ncbi:MAG: LPS export ABC transporter permease LptF [Syntrophobacteraceae bacterium]
MIYKRYFISEITKCAATIFFVIVIIFASHCAINYLQEAIVESLPPATVGFLILLRVAIALEVIIPATLFFAVVIALGRLYRDREMAAFSACGLGLTKVLKVIFTLSIPVALLAGYASLDIRPRAWQKIYHLRYEARNQFDISRLSPKAFLEIRSGKVVFFAEEIGGNNGSNNSAQKVFVHIVDGNKRKVISAQQMTQVKTEDGQTTLLFRDAIVYELPFKGEAAVIRTNQARYNLTVDHSGDSRYRRKAAPTQQLFGSSRLEDSAELQWRLSAPLSTILLALLAVPLSKMNPRRGILPGVGAAIVIFAFYFQAFVIARTWVDSGAAPRIIGIWWTPALLIVLVLFLLWRTGEVFYRSTK